MCTAYEIGRQAAKWPARIKTSAKEKLSSIGEPRLVRPTLNAPVLLADGGLSEMSWGFRRQFRGATGKPVWRTVVNAREDKLTSPMWAEAFRKRRCLIPATAFYEWTEGPGGRALPLRFTASDGDWLWIAGIWESGDTGPCFSMLTTEPSAMIRQVHDRMPAVLADSQIDSYLDGRLELLGPSTVSIAQEPTGNFLRKPNDGDAPELPF